MLVIRDEQIFAFSTKRIYALSQSIYVSRLATESISGGDARAAVARIHDALRLAISYGFLDGATATAFVELVHLWGDSLESHAWAGPILRDRTADAATRMRALMAASESALLERLMKAE